MTAESIASMQAEPIMISEVVSLSFFSIYNNIQVYKLKLNLHLLTQSEQ